jgi:LPS-assembly lipoprotein
MWWSRRVALILMLLPLGGCGFHPLYGGQPAFSGDPTLATIAVLPIEDRIGQILEDSLREQFNPLGLSVKPHYLLKVTLTVARTDLGIQLNATSLRSRLTLLANFTMTEAGKNAPFYTDHTSAVTSFNLPDNAYAATVAEDHARAQAADDLSQDIATRITLFLRQRKAG